MKDVDRGRADDHLSPEELRRAKIKASQRVMREHPDAFVVDSNPAPEAVSSHLRLADGK